MWKLISKKKINYILSKFKKKLDSEEIREKIFTQNLIDLLIPLQKNELFSR